MCPSPAASFRASPRSRAIATNRSAEASASASLPNAPERVRLVAQRHRQVAAIPGGLEALDGLR